MRRQRDKKITRIVLRDWAATAVRRREKRAQWSNAMRMFIFRSQWRAIQAWRAAVVKKRALRVHLSIARRWHAQRLAMSVIYEWSKLARKRSTMKERIRQLQGSRVSQTRTHTAIDNNGRESKPTSKGLTKLTNSKEGLRFGINQGQF